MEIETKAVAIFTLVGIFILIPLVASTFQSSYQDSASLSPTGMMLASVNDAGSSIASDSGGNYSSSLIPSMKTTSYGPDAYEGVLQTPYGEFRMAIDHEKATYQLQDHEKKIVIIESPGSREEFFTTYGNSINRTTFPEKTVEEFSNAYGWVRVTREGGRDDIIWYGGNFSYLDSEYSRTSIEMTSYRNVLDSIIQGFSIQPVHAAIGIYINEFMADPGVNGTEWIELYNNLSSSVSLGGWMIDDSDGGSSPYEIPANTTIPGKGFLVFYANVTGIALNNNGDMVRLYDSTGNLADSFAYSSSSANVSIGRVPDSGQWVNITTPTPGSTNNG